jgi:hypothetical protein
MSLQLPPLSLEQNDARFNLLRERALVPVTFYTNAQFSFTIGTPYATNSYIIPSYSGLAYVASNFLIAPSGPFTQCPVQVQLSLAPTPIFTDAAQDTGNLLFCAHAPPGTSAVPTNTTFVYAYQEFAPKFIPLQTGTVVYVHYVQYPAANRTGSIVHRLVMGLAQTGLQC